MIGKVYRTFFDCYWGQLHATESTHRCPRCITLHHIIYRGIERGRIFSDDQIRTGIIYLTAGWYRHRDENYLLWLGSDSRSCPYPIANRIDSSCFEEQPDPEEQSQELTLGMNQMSKKMRFCLSTVLA